MRTDNQKGLRMKVPQIEHVFVLMLENRSFDHMLGFSQITGNDASSGQATAINGLTGHEQNFFNGQTGTVSKPAARSMVVDPSHEFDDVLSQLCGPNAKYTSGSPYPPITNSGYMANYATACLHAKQQRDVSEILQCYDPSQLPVLNALAKEFAVCDNWHASIPGPTWPNRMFIHAASSGGLEHSPTVADIVRWETVAGFAFKNGTIFDRLTAKGLTRRLYAGDDFPMMAGLKGIHLSDIRHYSHFATDLQGPFTDDYIFIEPSYHLQSDYKGSTSQHPLDDVALGEGLIKNTYEAIRNSPLWEKSLLILTWDEHGGFFDHSIPPAAVPPGDTLPNTGNNQSGFTFDQYGPRVPAIVISPWIPKNIIDHRLYDHSSVPATLEALFELQALTERDRKANNLLPLLSLSSPRTDTPAELPSPANGVAALSSPQVQNTTATRPLDSMNEGNFPSIIHAAMRQQLEINPADRDQILAKVSGLKTRADAAQYLSSVSAELSSKGVR
jgi:phospholipase C